MGKVQSVKEHSQAPDGIYRISYRVCSDPFRSNRVESEWVIGFVTSMVGNGSSGFLVDCSC